MSCQGDIKGTLAFKEHHEDLDWWQKTVIYQIYPRSFQDSNGDGIGDLKGIISRLNHFEYLGVKAIWLSPVYASPMKDFGYDVSDFMDIDPVFGTLEDMDKLIQATHAQDIKIIMDFIPNHTSDTHPWFVKSRLSTENEYSDFYIWSDGKAGSDGKREPPNNWISAFGGPAWTWVDSRKQFYFHQYLKEQPDLNWRNPEVLKKMNEVLLFWLDRGVDGFRIDAIAKLFEDEDLSKDEPRSNTVHAKPDEYRYLKHIYTRDQQGTYDTVLLWKKLFSQYESKTGRHHIYMGTEVTDRSMTYSMKYYDYGSDSPFNFNLVYIDRQTGGYELFDLVNSWLSKMPDGKWPNWVMGNHDRPRLTSVKGSHYASALNVLLLLLPGTPTTYQGEEIGMLNIELTFEQTKDPNGLRCGQDRYKSGSRDPCRAPMQWSAEKSAGFTTASNTWLPVHPNYRECNVEIQKLDASSTLNIYKALVQLRTEEAFQKGCMVYNTINANIFSFVRGCRKGPKYLVVINIGNVSCSVDCTCKLPEASYTLGKVILDTGLNRVPDGENIHLAGIEMATGQAKVIKLNE